MAKVAIVVPVFNGQNYLKESLESIKNQTFVDFEVLIVDDGSNLKTDVAQIVITIDDGRFKILHKDNGGVASALNYGISQAKSEFIAWLSHDDIWERRKLETQLISFEKDTNMISFSNYFLVDQDSQIFGFTNFEDEHKQPVFAKYSLTYSSP